MILNLTEKMPLGHLSQPTNQPSIHPTNQQNIQKANFKEAGKKPANKWTMHANNKFYRAFAG